MLLLNKTLISSLFVYFILFYFTLSYFRELTSVLPAHGRRQALENTGVRLWTRLCSRRACHEEGERTESDFGEVKMCNLEEQMSGGKISRGKISYIRVRQCWYSDPAPGRAARQPQRPLLNGFAPPPKGPRNPSSEMLLVAASLWSVKKRRRLAS